MTYLQVSHVFTVPLEELIHTRVEKIYHNETNAKLRRSTSDRMGSTTGDQTTREVLRKLDRVDRYKMPVFPSPLSHDPDIWGLTAILTDRLLLASFRKDGYQLHDFNVS